MDWAIIAVYVIIGLYWWYQAWEDKRARERPAKIKRQTRHWEIDVIAAMSELWLRNLLIADLKEIVARERAKEWAREHYGVDL